MMFLSHNRKIMKHLINVMHFKFYTPYKINFIPLHTKLVIL